MTGTEIQQHQNEFNKSFSEDLLRNTKPRKGLKMAKATKMSMEVMIQSLHRTTEIQGGMINALTEKLADLQSNDQILTRSITAAGEFLTPELRKKIDNMHNIEGDIITFNDRLQKIQEDMMPTEKIVEKMGELKKMFKRVNKAHGDLFRAKAEQEGVNDMLDQRISVVQKNSSEFIMDFSKKHNQLVTNLAKNPWLKITGWLNYERAFWLLAGLWSSFILLKMVTHG